LIGSAKSAKTQASGCFHYKFHPLASSRLPRFWIDDSKRRVIGDAFAKVIAERIYTVWACAILSNHALMVVRRHRDDAREIWRQLATDSLAAIRQLPDVGTDHAVWSGRTYKVFVYTSEDVHRLIDYIRRNPEKEGLSPQEYPFVTPYNNWLSTIFRCSPQLSSPLGKSPAKAYTTAPVCAIFHDLYGRRGRQLSKFGSRSCAAPAVKRAVAVAFDLMDSDRGD
jgi:hypothetical protein